PRRLTGTRHLCDSHVKVSQLAAMRFKHVVAPACRKEPKTECGSRRPGAGRTSARASAVGKWERRIAACSRGVPLRTSLASRGSRTVCCNHIVEYVASCVNGASTRGTKRRERQVLWLP